MGFERKWQGVPPTLFTSNGSENGSIAVVSTSGFKVKQTVTIESTTQPIVNLQVKRVLSSTVLIVGPLNKGIDVKSDISSYLVADGATVSAVIQSKSKTPPADHEHAVYEQEPTLAKRVIGVDEWGNFYDEDNPISVKLPDFVGQSVQIITTTVTTSAIKIEVPEGVNKYTIFHQTEDGVVHWGDNNVDSNYPTLIDGDVIEIEGEEDFEIYGVTTTGTITVFAVSVIED